MSLLFPFDQSEFWSSGYGLATIALVVSCVILIVRVKSNKRNLLFALDAATILCITVIALFVLGILFIIR